MSTQGYIYVLINPAMPGLLKIGLTTKTPEERVKELSSATGVPINFILIYKEFFQNCATAEKAIHSHLEAQGYRFNKGREFFEAEPSDVINIIKEIKYGECSLEENDEILEESNIVQPWAFYENKGNSFFLGSNGVLEDYEQAYDWYLKAFELGSPTAPKYLCTILRHKYLDAEKATKLAIGFLNEGISRNNTALWIDLGYCYSTINIRNSIKAFKNYISNQENGNNIFINEDIFLSSLWSIYSTIWYRRDKIIEYEYTEFMRSLLPYKKYVMEGIENMLSYYESDEAKYECSDEELEFVLDGLRKQKKDWEVFAR